LAERPLIVAPHSTVKFGPLTFRPKRRSGLHSSVLVLRNNLTVLELVKLRGEGGTPVVRLLDNGLETDQSQTSLGTDSNEVGATSSSKENLSL